MSEKELTHESTNNSDIKSSFRSGFVAIVGAPNVGKSTMLNQFLGEKVAIITPKPQTTRTQIRGILTRDNFQIVFVDTPGIHSSKKALNKALVEWAEYALKDVDVIVFVIDASKRERAYEEQTLKLLKEANRPVICVLNKVDKISKPELLPMIDELKEKYPFKAIIPVAAKYGDGLDIVLSEIVKLLPEGPKYYDETTTTDQSPEQIASEIIREKVFMLAGKEVPYSTAVDVEEFYYDEERRLLTIRAIIYVERPSQKGIMIGKQGRFLKQIGKMAREELEAIFGKRIYLDLWVKVLKDWSKDERAIKRLGLSVR